MDQAVINGLAEGSVYALLALGLIFINRITQGATFAHGDVVAFSAFVGYTAFAQAGAPLALAVACSIVSGGLLGFLIERIVIRRVQDSGLLATIIMTLGLYFLTHNAVVEAPGGAHPTSCFPDYVTDVANIVACLKGLRRGDPE